MSPSPTRIYIGVTDNDWFRFQRIWMPGDPKEQPDRQALEWHADEVFLR